MADTQHERTKERQAHARFFSFPSRRPVPYSYLGSVPLVFCFLQSLQDFVHDTPSLRVVVAVLQRDKHAVPCIAPLARPHPGLRGHLPERVLDVLGLVAAAIAAMIFSSSLSSPHGAHMVAEDGISEDGVADNDAVDVAEAVDVTGESRNKASPLSKAALPVTLFHCIMARATQRDEAVFQILKGLQ